MKKHIALLAAIAALTLAVHADPVVVQPLAVPPQPVRVAPLVLSATDAVAAIAQIKSDGGKVMLSGSMVAVTPPFGMLITTGTNAGKISVSMLLRPQ